MDKQHVFMAFAVSNSVGKTLGECNVRALGKTIEKRMSGKVKTNLVFQSVHLLQSLTGYI